MIWAAFAFIGAGILIFGFKLDVARNPAGGAPVLDGVVFPPIFATFGLVLLGLAKRVGAGDWIYFVVWLALTLLTFWAINSVGSHSEQSEE